MAQHELYEGVKQADVDGLSSALAGKADDSAVVHNTGDESVQGVKTVPSGSGNSWVFNQPPQIAVGTQSYHAVRRDDSRLTDARVPSGWADAAKFGALGDSTTDDTAALTAAINSLPASGGVLHLAPNATYRITAALPARSWLEIDGNGSHIRQDTAAADGLAGVDITGLRMRNLTLRRGTPLNGTGKGVRLTRSSNPATPGLVWSNVTVRDFGSDGIELSNPITSAFDVVEARNNGGHGWNVHGVPGGAAGTSCRMAACYANGNQQTGWRLENMTYTSLAACAADHNGIQYELISCQGVELAASGCETPVNRSTSYPGHGVVVNGGFGVVLDALWTFEALTTSLWVTGAAKGVVVRSMAENSPQAAATHCVKVDSGCRVTIEDCNNVRPYSFAGGTTSILNDGGGLSVPGYVYGASTAYFEGEIGTSAGTPSYDGALTPRGWVNTQLVGKAAASHTHAASPRTVTYAGSITLTPLSGVDVDRVNITATGGPTITPGTGTDGQIIRLAVLASGAQRVVTIAASVRLSTGITVRTLTIPQNQAGVIGLEYVGLLSAWVLFAAYVTST